MPDLASNMLKWQQHHCIRTSIISSNHSCCSTLYSVALCFFLLIRAIKKNCCLFPFRSSRLFVNEILCYTRLLEWHEYNLKCIYELIINIWSTIHIIKTKIDSTITSFIDAHKKTSKISSREIVEFTLKICGSYNMCCWSYFRRSA